MRPLTAVEEIRHVEELQRRAWGMDDVEVVPLSVLITAAKNEGMLIGAFAGGEMIGFTFGFLCAQHAMRRGLPVRNRLKLCSHMTAVLPEYRDQGVGYALKVAQRDHAIGQGLDLITWTYDPLEGRNAALNISKLGAVSNTYLRNIYGEMRDHLNAGLPTDRLQVDWWIESRRVNIRLSGQRARLGYDLVASGGAALVNPAAFQSDGTPWPSAWQPPDGLLVMVEVPANFQTIKRNDRALAQAWREHTRELFEACFAAGYIVTDFLGETVGGWPRNFYVLTRQEDARAF
jgi:predicted GNAT superfamily acetyltransferase